MPEVEAPERFGPYVLERRLGAGGMAEVFLGHLDGPGEFQKRVVLKRLLPLYVGESDYEQMFLDEARLAARFNHPNLIHVYQLVEVDGQYGLAMEYVEGIDLKAALFRCVERVRDVPLPIATHIVAEAAQGLHYAHELTDEQGTPLHVVHRDIALDNIIVTWDGTIKVVDFGIAKHEERQIKTTQAGMLKGKLPYMSPEQVNEDPLDGRADIFSLGVVYYRLITGGARCFKRRNPLETVAAINRGDYRPASQHRSDLDPELEQHLDRMLASNRDDRFPTAGEVARVLRRYLAANEMPGAEDVARFLGDLYDEADRTAINRSLILDKTDIVPVSGQLAKPNRPIRAETHRLLMSKDTVVTASDRARAERAAKQEDEPSLSAALPRPRAHAPLDETAIAAPQVARSKWPFIIFPVISAIVGGLVVLVIAATLRSDPEGSAENADETMVVEVTADAASDDAPREAAADDADPAAAVDEVDDDDSDGGDERKTRRKRRSGPPPPGRLTLSSTPPMEVILKGKRIGTTPLADQAVPPGRHQLKLVNKQHDVTRTITVNVAAGKTTHKEVELGTGYAVVRAIPNADVYLRGRRLGTTPLKSLELYEGKHVLELRSSVPGSAPRRVEVVIVADEAVVVPVVDFGG